MKRMNLTLGQPYVIKGALLRSPDSRSKEIESSGPYLHSRAITHYHHHHHHHISGRDFIHLITLGVARPHHHKGCCSGFRALEARHYSNTVVEYRERTLAEYNRSNLNFYIHPEAVTSIILRTRTLTYHYRLHMFLNKRGMNTTIGTAVLLAACCSST